MVPFVGFPCDINQTVACECSFAENLFQATKLMKQSSGQEDSVNSTRCELQLNAAIAYRSGVLQSALAVCTSPTVRLGQMQLEALLEALELSTREKQMYQIEGVRGLSAARLTLEEMLIFLRRDEKFIRLTTTFDYLDMPTLLEHSISVLTDLVKCQSPEDTLSFFGIQHSKESPGLTEADIRYALPYTWC